MADKKQPVELDEETKKFVEEAQSVESLPETDEDFTVLSTNCFTCGKSLKDLKRDEVRICGKCKLVAYCSMDCLRKGYKKHAKSCNPGNADMIRSAAKKEMKEHDEEEKRKAEDPQQQALKHVAAVHDTDKLRKEQEEAERKKLVEAAVEGEKEKKEGKEEDEEVPALEAVEKPAAEEKKPLKLTVGTAEIREEQGSRKMTADAKRRLQAMFGTSHGKGMHAITGLSGEERVLTNENMDKTHTVIVQDCTDCVFRVEGLCTKVFFQGCINVKMIIPRSGRVVSATLEAFQCTKLSIVTDTPLMTVQVDACDGFDIDYLHRECMHMIVWAGCEKVHVAVNAVSESAAAGREDRSKPADWELNTGMEQMRAEYANLRADIDQFKIHFVADKLCNERVVRLNNGFPTTQREADEFDRRQEANLQKLAEKMGITIKPKPADQRKPKVGRNDPCPCGSGKKAKNCCYK